MKLLAHIRACLRCRYNYTGTVQDTGCTAIPVVGTRKDVLSNSG